ncbi:hypothetical protein AB656_01015 [Bifidobacterium actinocoloniiforme DSM 22766]|nr:hypothetical protein AB656_01015 [Bifidobacterium actinocoloniiforme DSM 22766]
MPQHATANQPDPPAASSLADWARAACVRAVKTAAQAAVAAIPASAATIGGVDWSLIAGTAALAAVLSVLTSIAGLPEVDSGASVRKIASK